MQVIAKKCAAMLLVWMLCIGLLSIISLPVAAAGSGDISMGNAKAAPGDTVQLAVKLTANPGLITMRIQINFDTDVLELTDVEDGGVLNGTQLNPSYGSPYVIAWIDGAAGENNTDTGTIAIFTFRVKADAPDEKTTIRLECKDSFDADGEKNIISSSSGAITVERVLCQTHAFGDPQFLDDAEHTRLCSVCGYIEKEKHNYTQWTATEQEHSRSCEACGHTQRGKHDWDEGTVIKQADCQEGGQMQYTCKLCQNSYIADTKPNDAHTYDHGCDTDCNVCGDVRETEHTFNTKWSKDKTHHWYECAECQEKKDVAEHIPGAEATEENAQTCTVCAYEIKPALSHKHDAAKEWTADELGHWYPCASCEEKVDYTDHTFQDACDADCDTCGYVRQAPHTYPEGWLNDRENHWRICSSCNEKILFAAHIPGIEATVDAPQYCTECGYELATLENKIATELMFTAPYGWPWWANTIAIAIVLGGIAILIIVPLSKKKH